MHCSTNIGFNTDLSCHRQVFSFEQKQKKVSGEHLFSKCSIYNGFSPDPSCESFSVRGATKLKGKLSLLPSAATPEDQAVRAD